MKLISLCLMASSVFANGFNSYSLVDGQPDVWVSEQAERIGATWNAGSVWERPLINRFYHLLQEKKTPFTVLDIGAQTGCFTLLAKYFPDSQWMAFEPIQEAAAALQENLQLNEIYNVTVFPVAVSGQAGTALLKLPTDCHWGLTTLGDHPQRFSHYSSREIECIQLDTFLPKGKVDFMKIDTEGWELHVLKGGKEMISRDKPVILMECHPTNLQQCGISSEEVLAFLEELDYRWEWASSEDLLCVPKDQKTLVSYTPEEMQEHKRRCMEAMRSNPVNIQDHTYQMQRALLTVSGDDADYIPKVPNAGEVFREEGKEPYQLMHNGVKVILNSYYDSQWLTDVIFGLKGHHEPQEEKCFYEILKYIPEKATMIELGAYWAYYSLWFASEVKEAKNYLIEPDPRRLEIGKKNFALNNRSGHFQRGYAGVVVDRDPDLNGAEYIAIDDFIERGKIEHVHILHSDIQGSEFSMLNSAVRSLDKIDYFVISTHYAPTDHYPCLEFLLSHGFEILAEHTNLESCSGDGLIVAKRKGVSGPDQIPIRKYMANY